MVKRWPAFFLVLLWSVFSFAQTASDLVELETDALSATAWQDFYRGLDASTRPLALDGRFYFSDASQYSLHSVFCDIGNAEALFNQRRDWKKGNDYSNFRLGVRSSGMEAVIGSYRFRFGRGLILGSGSRAASDSLFGFREPLSPLSYTPLSAGVKLGRGNWRAAVFASGQKREARLSGGLISSLPASRSGQLSSTRENLFGTALGYQAKHWRAGALLYRQNYDKDFTDSALEREIWSGGLCGAFEKGGHSWDAELALVQRDLACLIDWNYRFRSFEQTVSYAHNAQPKQLPYDVSAAVLDKDVGRSELEYGLKVTLPWKTVLQLRYGLNSGSSFTGGTLSRLLAALGYSEKGNYARLSFYGFDSEVIAQADSSYVVSDPRNFRVLFNARYRFRPRFYQQLDCQYSLTDKKDYTKNTYRFSLAFGYQKAGLDLKAGFLSWQSPLTFLAEDADNPEYYSVYGSDDNALFASAAQKFKRWHYSLSAQESLLRSRDFRIFLRLGLNLF